MGETIKMKLCAKNKKEGDIRREREERRERKKERNRERPNNISLTHDLN